ncbi:MAG: hypothetical protein U0136_00035 [Bdellovibrionota bacterium]
MRALMLTVVGLVATLFAAPDVEGALPKLTVVTSGQKIKLGGDGDRQILILIGLDKSDAFDDYTDGGNDQTELYALFCDFLDRVDGSEGGCQWHGGDGTDRCDFCAFGCRGAVYLETQAGANQAVTANLIFCHLDVKVDLQPDDRDAVVLHGLGDSSTVQVNRVGPTAP